MRFKWLHLHKFILLFFIWFFFNYYILFIFPPMYWYYRKISWYLKKKNIVKDPEHRHDWIVIFHSYHIISLLDIPSWSYGWKIGNWHIWPNFCDLWPYNLTFDLYYFTKKCLFIAIIPNKYHDHWTFWTESMAEKSEFWPKINGLCP